MTIQLDVTTPTQVLVHLPDHATRLRALVAPGANRFHHDNGLEVLRLAPDRALVLDRTMAPYGVGGHSGLVDELRARMAAVTDLSAGNRALRVHGPEAQAALSTAIAIDLRPTRTSHGHCASTAFGRVPVVLVRHGDDDFELLVTRSLLDYVTGWLAEARFTVLA